MFLAYFLWQLAALAQISFKYQMSFTPELSPSDPEGILKGNGKSPKWTGSLFYKMGKQSKLWKASVSLLHKRKLSCMYSLLFTIASILPGGRHGCAHVYEQGVSAWLPCPMKSRLYLPITPLPLPRSPRRVTKKSIKWVKLPFQVSFLLFNQILDGWTNLPEAYPQSMA